MVQLNRLRVVRDLQGLLFAGEILVERLPGSDIYAQEAAEWSTRGLDLRRLTLLDLGYVDRIGSIPLTASPWFEGLRRETVERLEAARAEVRAAQQRVDDLLETFPWLVDMSDSSVVP